MRAILLLTILSFNSSTFGAEGHAIRANSQKLLALFGPSVIAEDSPLTAEEVTKGGWTIDENGACDSRKGCPYKSPSGVTRYLPLNEKKKLEAQVAAKAEQEKDFREIASEEELKTVLGGEKYKGNDALVFIFSARNCGPCKVLKTNLEEKKEDLKKVGIFTVTRPDYSRLEGHPLHEKYGKQVSRVPSGLIYTKNSDGEWEGKWISAGGVAAAIKPYESIR